MPERSREKIEREPRFVDPERAVREILRKPKRRPNGDEDDKKLSRTKCSRSETVLFGYVAIVASVT